MYADIIRVLFRPACVDIFQRLIRNHIGDIAALIPYPSIFHNIRLLVKAPASGDCKPFRKAVLRAQTVSQMPFARKTACVALPCQNIGIGGHPLQIRYGSVLISVIRVAALFL